MSAVRNRRWPLELVPQPDTAADDTEWSINDPAATTDPAIGQPEPWATETVLDQWAPEHQLIGALMWLTADQARPILELVPDTAIWQPIRQWTNPHVERWHETFQRALQQLPGYEGRNTSERGRLVSVEPLVTAHELQDFLRRFVALDYHRSWHTGLILPGEPAARLCPLEMWDAMVDATGRIDVPQTPDLIYQFLPISWLTISHQGVEWANLVYDSIVLDDYRTVPVGYFRAGDGAAPFHVDSHDVSRIWFRDPKTERVEPVAWRGAARTDAPMTARIVATACRRIRDRGGNTVLNRDSATRQILHELTELARVDKPDADCSQLAAATLRVEQARRDHNEAQSAIRKYPRKPTNMTISAWTRDPSTVRSRWPDLLTED